MNLCVYIEAIVRNLPRQTERLPFVIWHWGMRAESWISLHVGKWNSVLTRLAQRHPHSQNLEGSDSQNHVYMAKTVSQHQSVF